MNLIFSSIFSHFPFVSKGLFEAFRYLLLGSFVSIQVLHILFSIYLFIGVVPFWFSFSRILMKKFLGKVEALCSSKPVITPVYRYF